MSGKYENKDSIEHALKMVFYMHRNTVKEFQTEIGQWIERCESFQKENSRLKEKLESLEKENKRLKEEKLMLKNNFENNLFVQSEIPKKISHSIQVHADYKPREHKPDSTDDPANQTIIKPVNQQLNSLHLDDALTDRLKNNNKPEPILKNKRSRYREDISPTSKKYKVSLKGDNSSNNTLNYVESSSRKTNSKEQKAVYVDKANKLCRNKTFRNNFASEIYMDHMCDGKDVNVNSEAKVNTAFVVPETLGMEETYSSSSENNYSDTEKDNSVSQITASSEYKHNTKLTKSKNPLNDCLTKKSSCFVKHAGSSQIVEVKTEDILACPNSVISDYDDMTTRLQPSFSGSKIEHVNEIDYDLIKNSRSTRRLENLHNAQSKTKLRKSKSAKQIYFEETCSSENMTGPTSNNNNVQVVSNTNTNTNKVYISSEDKIRDEKHTSNCATEETSTTFMQNSGTEISEKIASPKNESLNVTTDNINQTMLSPMFTVSPKFVVPLLETEYERTETKKDIELSTTDTRKRRTRIDKHRSVTSPDKYFMSPQRYSNPIETVAHSPSVLDSLPVICSRISPMLIKSHYTSDVSMEDMDVTVAPLLTDVEIIDSDKVLKTSISPDIHLRQHLQGHDSTTSPNLKKSSRITKKMCDIVPEVRNTRGTSDNAITEESQSLPCSFQFGTRQEMNKILKTQDKNIAELEGVLKHEFIDEDSLHQTVLNSSYDRVIGKKDVEFAYVKVVKKQAERKKLQGHSCKECFDYYKLSGMSEEDIQNRIKDCSRHRAEYIPPDTPDHFWSIGFPDTQECHERGYAQSELSTKPSTYRRKRQLKKKF